MKKKADRKRHRPTVTLTVKIVGDELFMSGRDWLNYYNYCQRVGRTNLPPIDKLFAEARRHMPDSMSPEFASFAAFLHDYSDLVHGHPSRAPRRREPPGF